MLTSWFCIPESFIPSSTAQWGPAHRNSSKQFLLITHSLLKHIVFILLGSGSRAGSVYPAQPFPDCHPQPRKASSPQDGWELGRDTHTQKHPGCHRRAGSHFKEGWEGWDIPEAETTCPLGYIFCPLFPLPEILFPESEHCCAHSHSLEEPCESLLPRT